MKERPILFSGPMVRAILEGRKTQTRRVVKNGEPYVNTPGEPLYFRDDLKRGGFGPSYATAWCPYGQPGDRLWVRETWGESGYQRVEYKAHPADGEHFRTVHRWRPSIHMPRAASRITLEVTGVRVERLQDISQEDARAEGIDCWIESCRDLEFLHPAAGLTAYPTTAFSRLWDTINGDGAWHANPWVWVVEFRRIQ